MAFKDNFKKLLSQYGEKVKVNDKDKAILEIANQIVNGGGGGGEVEQQIAILSEFLFGSPNQNQIDGALKIKYLKSDSYGTVTTVNISNLISIYKGTLILEPLSDVNCANITEIPLWGLIYRANTTNKPMFAHFTGADVSINYPINQFNNLYMLRAFVKTDGTISIKNELLTEQFS